MEKGILYIMKTAVSGLIKIGKTDTKNFESRMYNLEHNGYSNVAGLKRQFAIEVEDYSKKEILLHTIFAKSRVDSSELFALDINIAIQLMAAFDGKVVYPMAEQKEDIFNRASDKNGTIKDTKRITFEKLNIPVGSTLVYQKDPNVTCTTCDNISGVIYQGKKYSMSGFIKYLHNGKGSWQGARYLMFKDVLLTQINKNMGY